MLGSFAHCVAACVTSMLVGVGLGMYLLREYLK